MSKLEISRRVKHQRTSMQFNSLSSDIAPCTAQPRDSDKMSLSLRYCIHRLRGMILTVPQCTAHLFMLLTPAACVGTLFTVIYVVVFRFGACIEEF